MQLRSLARSPLPFRLLALSGTMPTGVPLNVNRDSEPWTPTLPVWAETAVRNPWRQGALRHMLGPLWPLWPSPYQWSRKVTWTRKWSSSRRHWWELGAGIRVWTAGGRTAEVSHLWWRRTQVFRLVASPLSWRAASQASCRSEPLSRAPLSRCHHDQGR